jgi:hypothetical protein
VFVGCFVVEKRVSLGTKLPDPVFRPLKWWPESGLADDTSFVCFFSQKIRTGIMFSSHFKKIAAQMRGPNLFNFWYFFMFFFLINTFFYAFLKYFLSFF